MSNFKTTYAQMYMIPDDIYEKMLKCIDDNEMKTISKIDQVADQNITENQNVTINEDNSPNNNSQNQNENGNNLQNQNQNENGNNLQNQDENMRKKKNQIVVKEKPQNISQNENLEMGGDEMQENQSIATLNPENQEQELWWDDENMEENTEGNNREENENYPIWVKDKQIEKLKRELDNCNKELVEVYKKNKKRFFPGKKLGNTFGKNYNKTIPKGIKSGVTKPIVNPIRKSTRTRKAPKKYGEFDVWLPQEEEMKEDINEGNDKITNSPYSKLKHPCPHCDKKFTSKARRLIHISHFHNSEEEGEFTDVGKKIKRFHKNNE